MTMKKKLLALTSIVLILGMAALGILAYLTATAEAENTLAAGDVAIELIEQERVNGTLDSVDNNIKDFQNNSKALVPATADFTSTGYWSTANNAVDKIVSVKNTGDNAAYVRVWYAFESGVDASLIKINKNTDGVVWNDVAEAVEIEGVTYFVKSATYTEVVPAGGTTPVSLKQVALDGSATNDTMAGFGEDGYQILVFAQAVQADGFDSLDSAMAGLEKDLGEGMPWEDAIAYDPISASEINSAVTTGGTYLLTDDATLTSHITKDTTINLGGNTLTVERTIELQKGADLTIKNGSYYGDKTYGHIDVRHGSGTDQDSVVTFENVNFTRVYASSAGTSYNAVQTILEMYPGTSNSKIDMTFKNCVFNNARVLIEGSSSCEGALINATFEGCTFNNIGNTGAIKVKDSYLKSVISVTDCVFNITSTSGVNVIDVNSWADAKIDFSGSNVVNGEAADSNIYLVHATPYVKVINNGTVSGLDTVTVKGIATK